MAGEAAATAAAGEAFAQFRAAVVAADDPSTLNPEALLRDATRHAAARHATVPTDGRCRDIPRLLAARADRSITLAQLDILEAHLSSCWACREPVARFEAAARAYHDPGDTEVSAPAAEHIVAALAAAAPVRVHEEPLAPVAPAPVAVEQPPPAPVPVEQPPPAPVAVEQPPPAPVPVAEREPPPVPVAPVTAAALNGADHVAATEQTTVLEPAGPAALDQRTTEYRTLQDADLAPAPTPAPEPTPAEPALNGVDRSRRSRGAPLPRLVRRPSKRKPKQGAAALGGGGATHLPRPERGASHAARGPRGAHRPLRAAVALPIVLVGFALVAALFVAGVFGAGDPISAPSSATPPAARPPAATTTPEVVVVPSADEASADQVEAAKARARAQAKRRRAASVEQASSTPVAPAAAAPQPARAAPPPAGDGGTDADPDGSSTSGGTAIDADRDATGAEQLPAEQDTSTVPELAPPPEPAVPPPG